MSYELLSKLYYKDRALFEQTYLQRKNSPYATSLGMDIHGHEAFYVNLPEFVLTTARLYKKLSAIDKLCAELPQVAYESYAKNCLIDEIILSNDMEGVRSTRKDILCILDNEQAAPKKRRFDGMVWKYVLLLDRTQSYRVSLKNSQDVRALYDEIVLDEIAPADNPDGEIIRRDLAEVVSGPQQFKHRGVQPEERIIAYMDKTLQILKRADVPRLYQIAVIHYMIGYIHPFYDGNGRLSRFISSYLLKEEFNVLIALRLSYAIKEHKSDYYKTFDICNDPHNMGDLTCFLQYFARVIEQAEDGLLEHLCSGKEMLDTYRKYLWRKYQKLEPGERKKTSEVLWYLIQNMLFGSEGLDRQTLAALLQTSHVTVQNYMQNLISTGAPIHICKEGRKFTYRLERSELEQFLDM